MLGPGHISIYNSHILKVFIHFNRNKMNVNDSADLVEFPPHSEKLVHHLHHVDEWWQRRFNDKDSLYSKKTKRPNQCHNHLVHIAQRWSSEVIGNQIHNNQCFCKNMWILMNVAVSLSDLPSALTEKSKTVLLIIRLTGNSFNLRYLCLSFSLFVLFD